MTLAGANALVAGLHRQHKPAQGHRFSLGVRDDAGRVCGACIVGRPVARMTDHETVAEVTRLVTDGTPNACSVLYAAAARACKAMGFLKVQTFILDSETGTSLRAAGWTLAGMTSGGDWNRAPHRSPRRTDQPMCPKQRWEKVLNPPS